MRVLTGVLVTLAVFGLLALIWPVQVLTSLAVMALVEALAWSSAFLDWVDADAPVVIWRQAWALGHVTLVRRVVRRTVFVLAGIAPAIAMARRPTIRPKVVPTATPTLELPAVSEDHTADGSDAVVYDLPARGKDAA